MKTIEVVAAVIQNGEKVLATQRGYGDFKDGWEFPGGKVEPGESLESALRREIKEELNSEIKIKRFIHTVEYSYENFHLTMHCFLCEIKMGAFTLLEHEAAKWLTREELDHVDWLPADMEMVSILKNIL